MDITIITGRLTADPVRRTTQGGKDLADFTVATDRGRGDNKKTAFFRCTAWEGRAEPVLAYLHKGDLVCVTGTVNATAYTGKDGKVHSSLEITVQSCEFLQTKRREEPAQEEPEDFTPVQEELPF